MHRKYPNLLAPIRIGGVYFKNRIFSGPTGLHALSHGEPFPNEAAITHFANRARAGVGCVTCSGVSILPSAQDGKNAFWDPYSPLHLNALAELARRIQFYGARAGMELGITGVVSEGLVVSEGAPTIWGAPGREMGPADIERISDAYAAGAEAMLEAGFDMILLHFGHGLQVGQFLSPLTNRRTDEYGGTLENRARFPIRIIDKIRGAVGKKLLIEVRISGDEYEPGGIGPEEAIAFTRMIQDKIDLIHVSAGMHNPKWMTTTHPCGFLPPTPNIHLAAQFMRAGLSIPVAGIGGIQDLDEAERILADGRVDIVETVRGVIADTRLVQKAYAGRPEDVVPCVKCMRCHDSVVYSRRFSCTVNPRIGLEHCLDKLVPPAGPPGEIAVVGGGPAGMTAALLARERGHRVTLFERRPRLGGALQFADHVSFKYPLRRFKDFLVGQIMRSDITVRLNTEATAELLGEGAYDVVFAAVGARPLIPPIEGLSPETAIPATALYGNEDRAGRRVIVIGGGQVGCETALHLAELGRDVTIVELFETLAPDASPTHRAELLGEIERAERLTPMTGLRCTAVSPARVACVNSVGETVTLEGDTIVLAAGMRAARDVVDALSALPSRVIPVGDCVQAATVEQATRSAFTAVMSL